jgi:hypothetical protein
MDWRIFCSKLGFVLRNSKATNETHIPLTKIIIKYYFILKNKNKIIKKKWWLGTPLRVVGPP